MQNAIYRTILVIALTIWSSSAAAEIRLSEALIDDILATYTFYLEQKTSLERISSNHPSISRSTLRARRAFKESFGSSIQGIDATMEKFDKDMWVSTKEKFARAIQESSKGLSKPEAMRFLDVVRDRAKGNIKSPILETLLLFKHGYETRPEREFTDGFKLKYRAQRHSKAKGLDFSIEHPNTWIGSEGGHPDVVQEFTNQIGRGPAAFSVAITDISSVARGEQVTKEDVSQILNARSIKQMIPDDARYIDHGPYALKNLPGLWVRFDSRRSHEGVSINIESIWYLVFYQNKMITLYGYVTKSADSVLLNSGGITRHKKLFDLMASSLAISSIYR